MNGEELKECILDVDKILSEAESSLETMKYKDAMLKIKEARDAIEDLREDDEAEDTREDIEMEMVDDLK